MQWKHVMSDMSMMINTSNSKNTINSNNSNNMDGSLSSSQNNNTKFKGKKTIHFANKNDDFNDNESNNTDDDNTDSDNEDSNESSSSNINKNINNNDNDILDHINSIGKGDESGAIKPWIGAIRAPQNPPPFSIQPPPVQLELKWVHGYTSSAAGPYNTKVSNNLFYNCDGSIVYPAAALAVLLNKKSNSKSADKISDKKSIAESNLMQINNSNNSNNFNNNNNTKNFTLSQTFFTGHNDDILCLAISNDRRFVATGQTASKTSNSNNKEGKGVCIILWDAIQGRIITRLENCHQRGVTSLAFNHDGDKLLSIGLDDNNSHVLWSDAGGGWSRVIQVSTVKCDKNTVFFLNFFAKSYTTFLQFPLYFN
jgi:microtubule-associated protein-like 6